jgi:hypothetical protein
MTRTEPHPQQREARARPRVGAAPAWMRASALLAPVWATVLGAAMAVQGELGAGTFFVGAAPGAATVGPWMAENLPLMSQGDPVWWWRGPFFLALLMVLPFAWWVSARTPSAAARWCTRGGLVAAALIIGVEYSTAAGHGWILDLLALLVALLGTLAVGLSGLRAGMSRRVAWPLLAALPLTPLAGFLVFWYLPPGLAIGMLVAWAAAALLSGRGTAYRRPAQRTFST